MSVRTLYALLTFFCTRVSGFPLFIYLSVFLIVCLFVCLFCPLSYSFARDCLVNKKNASTFVFVFYFTFK